MKVACTRMEAVGVVRSGQILEAFWRYSQYNFLTDWMWGVRERGAPRMNARLLA